MALRTKGMMTTKMPPRQEWQMQNRAMTNLNNVLKGKAEKQKIPICNY